MNTITVAAWLSAEVRLFVLYDDKRWIIKFVDAKQVAMLSIYVSTGYEKGKNKALKNLKKWFGSLYT